MKREEFQAAAFRIAGADDPTQPVVEADFYTALHFRTLILIAEVLQSISESLEVLADQYPQMPKP